MGRADLLFGTSKPTCFLPTSLSRASSSWETWNARQERTEAWDRWSDSKRIPSHCQGAQVWRGESYILGWQLNGQDMERD